MAAEFRLNFYHRLSPEEALKRMQGFFPKLTQGCQGKMKSLSESWSEQQAEFSFEMDGIKYAGILKIESSVVRMNGKAFIAVFLFDQIRRKIELVFNRIAEELLK